MRKLFITGTNTGVGKTLASALLCRDLMSRGNKVAYIKPVQTGCIEKGDELLAPDVEFVKLICGEEISTFCPIKFKLPASPHLSAAVESSDIDVEKLLADIDRFCSSASFDVVIIEGAGGITVPITLEFNMMDLCTRNQAELIVVTTTALGTLNHTKLTLDYAKAHGFEASVIVSGCTESPDIIEEDNIKLISEMVNQRVLAKIPFLTGLDTESDQQIILPQVQFQ